MSNHDQFYDDYPFWIVICKNVVNIITYIVGAAILFGFGVWAAVAYLVFAISMQFWVMRFRCKYCYYYGRTCSGGSGKIAAFLFEKGENEDFPKYAKYVTPLFLVWILPVLAGIILLITDFSLPGVFLLAFFIFLSFGLSNQVQKKLCCAHCKQRDDCTVYQLMHKPGK